MRLNTQTVQVCATEQHPTAVAEQPPNVQPYNWNVQKEVAER